MAGHRARRAFEMATFGGVTDVDAYEDNVIHLCGADRALGISILPFRHALNGLGVFKEPCAVTAMPSWLIVRLIKDLLFSCWVFLFQRVVCNDYSTTARCLLSLRLPDTLRLSRVFPGYRLAISL